jgi:hypothetical protein
VRKKFFQNVGKWANPTWSFFIWGTYTRPQAQDNSHDDKDKAEATSE